MPTDTHDPREEKARYLKKVIRPLLPDGSIEIEPFCEYFDRCGGCQLQHVPYEAQLKLKHNLLVSSFNDAGLSIDKVVDPVRGMPGAAMAYRNKADFSARTWNNGIHLGFRPHGGKGDLVEIKECPIAMPAINRTLRAIRRVIDDYPQLRRKLVSLVIRAGAAENRSAILFHSKFKDENVYLSLTRKAMAIDSSLAGGLFVKKRREYFFGVPWLSEKIDSFVYKYSLRSFFQANIPLLPLLCSTVKELIEPCPEKRVFVDIYCGVGLFTIYLADLFDEVYGIENSPKSVAAAQNNTIQNKIGNITFLRGTAEERLSDLAATATAPNLVVLDPPRSGLAPRVLECLVSGIPPSVLIMVSCNPVTMARDLAGLQKGGYRIERVIPVDMFPQTQHLEAVARLSRLD